MYIDILDDVKFFSDFNPFDMGVFTFLLAFACEQNKHGEIPYDVDTIAWRLRLDKNPLTEVIEKLLKKKILTENGSGYRFVNWDKWQGKPDYSIERIKKYRDKRQALGLTRIGNYNRKEILEKCNHQCIYCGKTEQETNLVIDHILPITLGGSDDTRNLVSACRSCNAQKAGRKLPWQNFSIKNKEILDSYKTYLSDTNLSRVSAVSVTAVEEEVEEDKEYKKRKVKKKRNKELQLPDWLDDKLWTEFLSHRVKLKKPMTVYAQELMIKKLTWLKNKGHNPEHLLKDAMVKGYQDVFNPRQ